MNKRFESAIQAAVLAGSIAVAGGLVASCDPSEAKSKRSSSGSADETEAVLGVDGGTIVTAQSDPFPMTGTKQAGTSVWINGVEAVEVSSSTTWTADVDVSVGENLFTLVARDSHERQTDTLSVSVIYVPAPTVDGGSAHSTALLPYVFSGTKEPGAAVWLDGVEVYPPDQDTNWSVAVDDNGGLGTDPIVPGVNDLAFTAKLDGRESAEAEVTLDYTGSATPTLVEAWTYLPCNDIYLSFSAPVTWNGAFPGSLFNIHANRHSSVGTSWYDESLQSSVYKFGSSSFAGFMSFAEAFNTTVFQSGSNTLRFQMNTLDTFPFETYLNRLRLQYTQSATGILDANSDEVASFSLATTGEGFLDVWSSSTKSFLASSCSNP